jgi:predicted metalloprotease with PDZ domain
MLRFTNLLIFQLFLCVLPSLGASPARPAQAPRSQVPPAQARPAAISLTVDATEAPRKLFHSKLLIPVVPGPLTLAYPKWLPGEHSPNGPINGLAELHFMAGGKSLEWRRDLLDMYEFHLTIPAGVSKLEVSLDFLGSPVTAGFTAGASSTENLAVISLNQLLLYPKGKPADEIEFEAKLRLPAGWKYGTAMPVAEESDGSIQFKPVSLVTLIDSPVLTGKYFREMPLAAGTNPRHVMDLASDSDDALDLGAGIKDDYDNLVTEAGALFGARHYRHYNFLVTLSDHVAFFGLEHHESSDDRLWERSFVDAGRFRLVSGLLPHELVHSWNGKYRRPADLLASDYQTPVRTDLLWVYEGLTVYLASVLATRSGLWAPQNDHDYLALLAATLDHRPGRAWRNLQDTADAAQTFYAQGPEWLARRRTADFYDEGVLIWLEADAIIRKESGGKRSLDDFCKLFFGGSNSTPEVKPYTFDDVVAAMNQIQPYDWRGFFTQRLDSNSPHAPLGGLTRSGWKVVYTGQMSELQKLRENYFGYTDESFSVGLKLAQGGTIIDVIPDMAADEALLGPGMKIVAVNGREWSPERLRSAIRGRDGHSETIHLMVENGDFFRNYSLTYTGGEKFAHLERDATVPDLLAAIDKPLATSAAAAHSAQ